VLSDDLVFGALEELGSDSLAFLRFDMGKSQIAENNKNNAELVYQHTLQIIKEQKESLIRLDNKISATLGFSVLLLRLFEIKIQHPITEYRELTSEIYYLFFKAAGYIFTVICAVICVFGLKGVSKGAIIEPSDLLEDEVFNRSVTENKRAMVETLTGTIEEYYKSGKFKQKILNIALLLIVISISFSGIGTWIKTLFIVSQNPQ
jgi:hypothetical protein